jgi:predicted TIM-barrel fold metal-dependent hydrolase
VKHRSRPTRSAQIRGRLDHPVIDCDGHLREFTPQLLDYMRRVGGSAFVERYMRAYSDSNARPREVTGDFALDRLPTPEERRHGRIRRSSWWGMPTRDPLDAATPFLPELLVDRMDELGLDFTILYPTMGLVLGAIEDDEDRGVMVRALNEMHAEVYNASFGYRLTVPAVIPMQRPQDALAELDHCVGRLGFKAIKIPAMVTRPIRRLAERYPGLEKEAPDGVWMDQYGLDSEHDYDPVWQRCMELGVAVTSHGAAVKGWPWKSRSISNWTFNHMGNQPWQQEMLCKSLYMGGVTRRFPRLTFAFLECGCFWACYLLSDILEHWEYRGLEGLEGLNPANLDRARLHELLLGYDRKRFEGRLDQTVRLIPNEEAFPRGGQPEDDFAAMQIREPRDFGYLFENFFFGCEADDRMTAWAFDTRVNALGQRLNPIFSSDIGHMDAPDMTRVVEDSYALVEKGVLSEADYRDFMADNPIRLHGRMNPAFWEGTAVEDYARRVLAADTAWQQRR